MVKISYAICVCNEDRELNSLVNFLLKVKDEEDEVNILLDSKNVTPEVRKVLESYGDKIVVNEREFDGKFSDHRNYHATKCTGDYIFVIDADEMPQEALIANIKTFEGDIMSGLRIISSTLMKWGGLTGQIIKVGTIKITEKSSGLMTFMRNLRVPIQTKWLC